MPEPTGGGSVGRGGLSFLMGTIPGTPIPIWLVVVAGGIGAAFVVPKFLGKKGTDGGTSDAGTPQGDPTAGGQIDPNTGVPYSIEGAINPATGLPAYFGTGTAPGAPVTSQDTSLAAILAALQQIEQELAGQQNPSGAGGVPPGPANPPTQPGNGGGTGTSGASGGATAIAGSNGGGIASPSGPLGSGTFAQGQFMTGTGAGAPFPPNPFGGAVGPDQSTAIVPAGMTSPIPGFGGAPPFPPGPPPGGGTPPPPPNPPTRGTPPGGRQGPVTRWESLNGLTRR